MAPTALAPTSIDPAIPESEWSWGCQDGGCVDYRFTFNDDPSYTFSDDMEFSEATSSAPQGKNNGGDYYLHVQGRDAAGNLSNVVFRGGPFAFDNVAPRLSQVVVSASDNPNTAYAKAGNRLVFEATFDLSVIVESSGGAPQLALSIGGSPVLATFSGSSGVSGTTHNFSYTVEDNLNGIVRVQGLDLAGGTILDAGDGDPLSLEGIDLVVAGLTVDTTVPVVESIANDDAAESWSWGCSEQDCQYRTLIDGNAITSAVTGTYGVSATAMAPGIKGLYYIHIQARDPAGNESQVAHSTTALEVTTTTEDNVDPTVAEVTGTENSYKEGALVALKVAFSEAVTIGGSPKLQLTVGGVSGQEATFNGAVSSSTTEYEFNYLVAANLNGAVVVKAIDLNGGSIQDGSTNDAVVGGLDITVTGVNVDTTAPAVEDLLAGSDKWTWSCSESCFYRVVHNSSSTHTFGSENYVEMNPAEYSFPATTGDYYLHVQAQDKAGNESIVSSSAVLNVDVDAPTIVSAAGPEAVSTSYKETAPVTITVTFDEDVQVTGSPELSLEIGGPSGATVLADFAGTAGNLARTYDFTYTVGANHNGAVVIKGVTYDPTTEKIQDGASTPNDLVISGLNITVANVVADTVAPTVQSLVVSGSSWTWGCSESDCEYRFEFSASSTALATLSSTYGTASTADPSGEGVGTYYVHVQAKDRAGNESVIAVSADSISVTSPAVSFLSNKLGVGENYSCVLVSSGEAKCWGSEANGRLGNDVTSSNNQLGPIDVKATSGTGNLSDLVQISSGNQHTCALAKGGSVLCWGNASDGRLGNGETSGNRDLPVEVSGLSDAVQISSGNQHTCALTQGGNVKCWGANNKGQLGNGNTTAQSTPADVKAVGTGTDNLDNIVQVVSGRNHTCAVNKQKDVVCWGEGGDYQLGNKASDNQNRPVEAQISEDVAQVALGGWHSCALTTGGKVLCWGATGHGRLGNGNSSGNQNSGNSHDTPVNVLRDGTNQLENVVQITAGIRSTCALTQEGGVECWGRNHIGQLGDGTGNDKDRATSLSALSNMVEVRMGDEHACALSALGEVKCWGEGGDGQLGQGSASASSTPVTVLTSGATFVAGMYHRSYSCSEGDCTLAPVALAPRGGTLSLGTSADLVVDVFGIESAQSISLYGDSSCSTSALGTVTAAGSTATVSITGLSDGEYRFYYKLTNSEGTLIDCSLNGFFYSIDTVAPRMLASNGLVLPGGKTYGVGEHVDFVVTFDEDVIVAGTPVLELTIGTEGREAAWIDDGDGDAATTKFRYTILNTEGDDSDGIQWGGEIVLNVEEPLKILHGNAAVLDLTPGDSSATFDLSGVLVSVVPELLDITNSLNTNTHHKESGTVTFSAEFSEPVTVNQGTGSVVINLQVGTDATVTAAYNGDGSSSPTQPFLYTVASGHNDTDGVQVTGLTLNGDATIKDSNNNDATTTLSTITFNHILVDTIPPDAPEFSSTPAVHNINKGAYSISGTCSEARPMAITIADTASGSVNFSGVSCDGTVWSAGPQDVSSLASGTLTISAALGADEAGNPGEKATTTVEKAADDQRHITIESPGLINVDNQGNYPVAGTCSHPSDTVTVTVGAAMPGSHPTCTALKTWSTMVDTTAVNDGPSIIVQATVGNNPNQVQATQTVVKDTEVPQVAITTSPLPPLTGDNIKTYSLEGSCSGSSGEIVLGVNGDELPTGISCPNDGNAWSGTIDFGEIRLEVIADLAVMASLRDDAGNKGLSGESAISVGPPRFLSIGRITAGSEHSCALTREGKARCWGEGQYSRLGNGGTSDQRRPTTVKINSTTDLSNLVQIVAGRYFSCALTSGGNVRCWGNNGNGELGRGTYTGSSYAVFVKGVGGSGNLSDIVQIATGSIHACTLTSGGEVRCWGSAGHGRLGNGQSSGDRTAPVKVKAVQDTEEEEPLRDIVQVAVADSHSCALTSRGEVHCWGKAVYGRLGDGQSSTNRSRPVKVKGVQGEEDYLSNIVQIAAGREHTCAVTGGGEVRCWGRSVYGRLGDGQLSINRSRPVKVKGVQGEGDFLSGIVQVTTGDYHTCAVTSGGEVRCWGRASNGRLGDGQSSTNRSRPLKLKPTVAPP